MRRILVTIVGPDRPGIINVVSRALAENNCNLFEVSQTTLMGQFAGLFSCGLSGETGLDDLNEALSQALAGSGLAHWAAEAGDESACVRPCEAEPYVVTVRGPYRASIIPEFSGAMAVFEVNIDNLRVVSLRGGEESPEGGRQVLMFFELSVPGAVNQRGFRQALNLIAEDLDLEMSLQHRDIFEAIHRL